MATLTMIGQLLLALSLLVVIHELGHFMAARMFGVRVEKFYLFFDAWGVKLFSFKHKGVEYGVGWLPLGGYVKIAGMIDESMDKKFVGSTPEPHEFRAKPAWQRLIIMLGGIIMNVLLGLAIYIGHTSHYGEPYVPLDKAPHGIAAYSLGEAVGFQDGDRIIEVNGRPAVRYPDDVASINLLLDKGISYTVLRNGERATIVLPDDFGRRLLDSGAGTFIDLRHRFAVMDVDKNVPAYQAGLRPDDSILAVNGNPVVYFDQLQEQLQANRGQEVALQLKRGEDFLEITAPVTAEGMLQFRPSIERLPIETTRYSIAQSIPRGTEKAWEALASQGRSLWRLIKGDLPANKSISSLIGISQAYGGTVDWERFWRLTGLLSLVLAFMNLLPIPALDGGHILFLLVEMVRRRPLSYRFLEVAQMVGMVILFLLMGFALFNDLVRFVF